MMKPESAAASQATRPQAGSLPSQRNVPSPPLGIRPTSKPSDGSNRVRGGPWWRCCQSDENPSPLSADEQVPDNSGSRACTSAPIWMISGEVLRYRDGFMLIFRGGPPCPVISRLYSADITSKSTSPFPGTPLLQALACHQALLCAHITAGWAINPALRANLAEHSRPAQSPSLHQLLMKDR
jgi:hypothetical protein